MANVVIVGGIELAVAPAEDLQFFQEQLVARGVADPERGFGVDVHLGGLELLQQVLVELEDFEHLLHILCQREGIAGVTVAGEKFVVEIIAEGCAAHYPDGVAVALAKHLHQYAALGVGSLADADERDAM